MNLFREGDIVFDPKEKDFEDLAVIEAKLRPNRPNIVQLQMDDLDRYWVFIYPEQMYEFSDPDVMKRFLVRTIKDEELAERGMTLMANYRLVDIDLDEKVALYRRGYHLIS